jgi:hypothetical protein
MRKLTLKLDELAVQSFATSAPRGGRGTAHAHIYADTALPDPGIEPVQPGDTNENCLTCEASCGTRGC